MNTVINALVTTLLVASHALAHQMDQRAETLLAAAALSEGEIRRVDKEAKKLTIWRGPIANLDMPPMTMVFPVTNAAVLDQLKPGDKVRFQAEELGGAYTVTRIETAR